MRISSKYACRLAGIVMCTVLMPYANADVVTGWAVHNGTSTVGGTPAVPTFTPGDNLTLMAPFTPISLASDGQAITVSTILTLSSRTANTGVNALNTQLRFGLFNGPAGAIVAGDANNLGFIIEYSNLAAGGLIREQQSAIQTNPFTSPVNIGNGVQDSGADSLQGANPGAILLELTLTRNAGKLDLFGKISGTDSVSMNPYVSTYSAPGYSSISFPANGTFTFNRIGVFLGNNADATNATLMDSFATAIPESRGCVAAVAVYMGAVLGVRSRQRGASAG